MTLLEEIAEKKRALDSARPLSQGVVAELAAWFELETTVGCVLAENVSLARAEIAALLSGGGRKSASPSEGQRLVLNHRRALELLARLSHRTGGVLSERTLTAFHGLLYKGIDRDAGLYRHTPLRGDVPLPAADPAKVVGGMAALSGWLRRCEPGPDVAVEASLRLMSIRPFERGNAAVTLLLANLILQRADFPPIAIREGDIKAWRETLQAALMMGDRQAFSALMVRLMKQSLDVCLVAAAGSLKTANAATMPLPEPGATGHES